jgi:hypothetical protein
VGIEYRELRPRWLVGRDVEVAGQHFISCADTVHGETALERDGCKAGNEDGGDHGEVQKYALIAMVITTDKLKLQGNRRGGSNASPSRRLGGRWPGRIGVTKKRRQTTQKIALALLKRGYNQN